ncbi:hypothetical protein H1R20_g16053, partial [Candolleomyces eurysporus]
MSQQQSVTIDVAQLAALLQGMGLLVSPPPVANSLPSLLAPAPEASPDQSVAPAPAGPSTPSQDPLDDLAVCLQCGQPQSNMALAAPIAADHSDWYVVTKGLQVGVFTDWATVQPLVDKVSGATHKKYKTADEAYAVFQAALNKHQVTLCHR